MKATIKKIWDLMGVLIVAAAVLLAVVTAGMKLMGYDLFIVLSGSMEPAYPVGAVIYVDESDPGSLAPGDVITYRVDENTIVTHRIESVQIQDGEVRYVTKGDANEYPDAAPVTPDQIIGVPVFSIPMLGRLIAYVSKPPGFYLAISASAVLLLVLILPDIIFDTPKTAAPKKRRKPAENEKL